MNRRRKHFAVGYNIYKILWVFFLGGFIGNMAEITFYLLTTGKVISRSSMIYGQFSTVWGLGFVLLTVPLHKIAEKREIYIFFAGALLGGLYEYLCSFALEKYVGVRFWDYSRWHYNLNGRINLLFCLFWGVVAILWIKDIFPRLSDTIEKLPDRLGKVLTWILVAVFIADSVLSGMAVIRTSEREEGIAAETVFEKFIDEYYPTELVLERYPNMKLK